MAKSRTTTTTTTESSAPPKQSFFSWKFSLGHILAVVSFLASATVMWGHDEAAKAVRDTQIMGLSVRISNIENYNMPPRLAALEAQNKDTRDSLHEIRDVLIQIRTSLDTKADKR